MKNNPNQNNQSNNEDQSEFNFAELLSEFNDANKTVANYLKIILLEQEEFTSIVSDLEKGISGLENYPSILENRFEELRSEINQQRESAMNKITRYKLQLAFENLLRLGNHDSSEKSYQ